MELPGLAEPVRLRARVVSEPDAVRAEIASGRFIVTPLWKAWGPALAAQGVDRAALTAMLRGDGYELWMWAVGQRTWAQCIEGLAGRVSRRVGAKAPTKTARSAKRPGRAAKTTKSAKSTKTAKAAKSTRATQAAKSTRATKGKRVAGPARKTRGR